MTATLSPKAEKILADLPPYEADEPAIQRIVDAGAREMQRVEDFLTDITEQMRPQSATDQYGLLRLWEAFLGLSEAPEGVSPATRQETLKAAVRRRYVGAGEGWADLVALVLGGSPAGGGLWDHLENTPGPYQLQITIPTLDGYVVGQLTSLLRKITPAHIQLIVGDGDNFIVGIDTVGDPL